MNDFEVLSRYTNRLLYDHKLDIFNILADVFKSDLPRECLKEYYDNSVRSAYIRFVFDVAYQYDHNISVGLVYDVFESCYDSFIKSVRYELIDFFEKIGLIHVY